MSFSGVPTHTQDPINPAVDNHVNRQSSPTLQGTSPATTTTTPAASEAYPPVRPGAVAPTPTTPITRYGPPPPQPGAVPAPPPPMITAKPSLPPPPKVGEPLSHQPQPYPPQMSQAPLGSGSNRLPPASTTSTTTNPSFAPAAPSTKLPTSTGNSARNSLEHPPGYVQNPYASDMTPDQRFTAGKEQDNRSDRSSSLGYSDNTGRSVSSGAESYDGVLEAAMSWGREKGKQLGSLHDHVWDRIGRK